MANIPKDITARKMPEDHDSEAVSLKGDKVIWHNHDLVILILDLSDVVVIGEYINSNGPWFDDWFITFVTRDGKWVSIPLYAHNIDELLEVLSIRFHPCLKNVHLANSTTWNSIIRYPKKLEGIELFNRVPSKNYKAPKTWFQKLQYSLGFGNFNFDHELELNSVAKVEIAKAISK
jgi:hypothetical protein